MAPSLEQSHVAELLTKKLQTDKNSSQSEDSIDDKKPILPGDIMDMVLEYGGVDKNTDPLGFFNKRGVVSLNEFHTKLEAHHRLRIAQFLDHVVKGRLAEAEVMIKKNPEYLFESGDSMDYSGRRFHRTALQSALAAKDVCFREGMEECMAEMIIRHLKSLPNGEEAIAIQIENQFPASWKANEEKENKKDLAAVEAIVIATSPKEKAAAIQVFQHYVNEKYLKEKDDKPIIMTVGFDFNHNMLSKTCELYLSHSDLRNEIYCQVIGYLQRFLPACDGMAYSQGLSYLLNEHENFNRSLTYREGGNHIFPLNSSSGLGVTSALFINARQFSLIDRFSISGTYAAIKTGQCERLCSLNRRIERRVVAR